MRRKPRQLLSCMSAVAGLALATPAWALITFGDPSLALVPSGGYSGVGQIIEQRGSVQRPGCTASLLSSGRHVITAGHCVNAFAASVRFDTVAGAVFTSVSQRFVHPNLNGDDIAVLELAQEVDSRVARYDIYRGRDEVDQVFTKVAYGAVGTGEVGQTGRDFLKRIGENRFEGTFEDFLDAPSLTDAGAAYSSFASGDLEYVPQSYLMFDFDNGRSDGDAFGRHFGIADLGQGRHEINTGNGDSGSPAFIGGAIAGVTSFGLSDLAVFAATEPVDASTFVAVSLEEVQALLDEATYEQFFDFFTESGVTNVQGAFNNLLSTDSSFGEFSAEYRVSAVSAWIDGLTVGAIPEPPTLGLALFGWAAIAWQRRVRRRAV